MNKPKFNLDAHSILLLCNGEQVDTDAGKLQLTIVEQAEPKKPVIDLHKDSWGVLNDGSQRFKDTVVRWLNGNKRRNLEGTQIGSYYGVTKDDNVLNLPSEYYFTHILTIDEFCAIAYPKEKVSELVGKWVRCAKGRLGIHPDTNEWVEITQIGTNDPAFKESIVIKKQTGGTGVYPKERFDLSNPLDYNPETLVGKHYNGYKIECIEFSQKGNNLNAPFFVYGESKMIACSDLTPSDVTNEPPVKSLKYEDCFNRLKDDEQFGIIDALNGIFQLRQNNPRQANQLAATIELMTIMHDANGGDWIPREGDSVVYPVWIRRFKQCDFDVLEHSNYSPIYFRDRGTALRAYEENKEIFQDYFGINE